MDPPDDPTSTQKVKGAKHTSSPVIDSLALLLEASKSSNLRLADGGVRHGKFPEVEKQP